MIVHLRQVRGLGSRGRKTSGPEPSILPPVNLRLEHLPADVLGLADHAREALARGEARGLPVARTRAEIPRPIDRHDPGARAHLVAPLRRALEKLEAPGRVMTSLNVLEAPGSFCVVTGQQPGFLGGPLYTLYKALQACRLAAELSRDWGVPVVPVFWNHADDHDLAEVHHAHLLNRNLDLQRVGLAGLSSGRQPIGRVFLSEQENKLGATRAMVTQVFEEFPGAEAAVDLFFPREGETLASALTRALTSLLGEHGLVVVEPEWLREDLSRALAHVVSTDPVPHLLEGSPDEPAIDPKTAALVFHVDEGGRRALRGGGEGFCYDGESGSRTPAELAAEIVQAPDEWSAGALTRPLVQDLVFPTCAYVGGWGELAYHAQLTPLRDACDVPRIPFVPRISCTLVDPEQRHSLGRVDADVRAVLAAGGDFDPGGPSDGPPVIEALRRTAEQAAEALRAHGPELAEIEPALAAGLKKASARVRQLVEKVASKADRVHANRSGKGKRQLRRVNNGLIPKGLPQERVLGPLALTARFGRGWIDALHDELPPTSTEHVVVHIEDESE